MECLELLTKLATCRFLSIKHGVRILQRIGTVQRFCAVGAVRHIFKHWCDDAAMHRFAKYLL